MTFRKLSFAVLILLALTTPVVLQVIAAKAAAAPANAAGTTGGLAIDRSDTYQIAQLTGTGSINQTDAWWNVYGTDLGHMFEHDGQLYLAFGDSFGPPGRLPTFGGDWRSASLAFTSDSNPWDGLTLDGMITDQPGHAKSIIEKSDVPGQEVTVIPTNGISVGDRMYLHYMAVRHWGDGGNWQPSRSGLAYSDDDGQTWSVSDAWWPGDSDFGQVAFAQVGEFVYLFGIPGGRFGNVHLARVESQSMPDLDRYEFWDGAGWTSDDEAASIVAPAPVGELSVQWNSYYRQWLMTYLDDEINAVVLKTANCLTGPWSNEQVVVTAQEAPQLYAPYMPPWWNDGPDIFFTLSRFNLYNVFWWHTSLEGEPGQTTVDRCVAPPTAMRPGTSSGDRVWSILRNRFLFPGW